MPKVNLTGLRENSKAYPTKVRYSLLSRKQTNDNGKPHRRDATKTPYFTYEYITNNSFKLDPVYEYPQIKYIFNELQARAISWIICF